MKNSHRICIVSELYYPEETSTGYFLTKIAEGLAKSFDVVAICSQPTYRARGVLALSHENHNGVEINRCFTTSFDNKFLFFRVINALLISCSIFFKALRIIKLNDQVLVVTNPPTLPYLMVFACFIKRARCVLVIHDVYPDVLVAAGYVSESNLIVRIASFFSLCLYVSVNKIVVLGRDMYKLILEKDSNKLENKVYIIHNWADVDEIFPLNRSENPLLLEKGLADKFIVLYSGNMGKTHGIEDIVLSADLLNVTLPSVHFLMCGYGSKWEWLNNKHNSNAIKNITLLPIQPRSELNILLNACDVALISFVSRMVGVSVPSRLYNIFASGKPVIAVADASSELSLVIKEEGVGWVVPPGQPEMLAAIIEQAQHNREELKKMGQRARSLAESKYCFEKIIHKYHLLLS